MAKQRKVSDELVTYWRTLSSSVTDSTREAFAVCVLQMLGIYGSFRIGLRKDPAHQVLTIRGRLEKWDSDWMRFRGFWEGWSRVRTPLRHRWADIVVLGRLGTEGVRQFANIVLGEPENKERTPDYNALRTALGITE